MIRTCIELAGKIQFYNAQQIGNPIIITSCKATLFILLTFFGIVSTGQFYGQPLQCIQDSTNDKSIPEKVMNSFCFISSSFQRVAHKEGSERAEYEEIKEHSYYPWVPIIIFLQGLSFMLPQIAWSLNSNSYIEWYLTESKETLNKDVMSSMVTYISQRLHYFDGLVLIYVFGEAVFVLNILLNFIITDAFLGGGFIDYGYKAFIDKELYTDTIFPKLTRCTFNKYGPSGSLENRDALCVMSLNVLNEKLYFFLWFWFLLLAFISAFIIIKRTLCFCILSIRHMCPLLVKTAIVRNINNNEFNILIKKLSFSDWLLIEQIQLKMDKNQFKKLLENIAQEISEPHDLILGREKGFKYI